MKNKNNATMPTKNLHTKLCYAALSTMSLASTPLQGSFLKDSDPEPRKLTGIVMRSGFSTSASAQKELQDQHRRTVMKAVADLAQERAQAAQFIFSFKHNFLMPQWLREALPTEVSSRLLNLNMYGVTFSVLTPLEETKRLASTILFHNNLPTDLFMVATRSESKLLRLVNEAEFQKDVSPFERARHFSLLAMRLDDYSALGIDESEAGQMMSALYHKASQEVLFAASEAPHMFLGDLYTSAGQLSRWAAYRAIDDKKKITYVVDSLSLLKKARQSALSAENSGELLLKIKQEEHWALDFFEDLLLGRQLQGEGVRAFIAARRLEL